MVSGVETVRRFARLPRRYGTFGEPNPESVRSHSVALAMERSIFLAHLATPVGDKLY
jgi:hypothetical protein